ncbi:MAG: Uma2 family endonuclease [Candidatus Eremiobacterota bacterium]
MADTVKKSEKKFTYSDYATWHDDKRYEIISGQVYTMAPGASDMHQDVSVQLVVEIGSYLRGKKCKIYHPPFDVILPEDGDTLETAKNIVQPDIFVVCDKEKIIHRGCYGAPDLVVEILSPSTAKRDIKDKLKLYQRSGVREYWIVDPVHKTVQVYKVDEEGKYSFPETYTEDDKIKVGIFNDELEIDLSVVFVK